MSFENRRAEILGPTGQPYAGTTNPDGSITYWKQSKAGRWYEVRSDSSDLWLRSIPISVRRQLDMRLSQSNPLAPSTTELVIGGVGAIVCIGLGVTMIYTALNTAGADTSDTLQNTAALAALAGVV